MPPTNTDNPQHPPHLLNLPLEIRHQIFAHLSRHSPRSYPFRFPSSISSVDQLGPPLSLVLTCRALSDQIQAYYYGKATFSFFSQAIIPIRTRLTPPITAAVRRMRKVEFVFLWNVLPRQINPAHLRAWLVDHVGLLRDDAPHLHTVTVSVRGASQEHDGNFQKSLLEPLQELRGRVRFNLGVVIAHECEDELRQELKRYLDGLNEE
jgi:hypothetical protein